MPAAKKSTAKKAARLPAAMPKPAPPGAPIKVLVVDDDAFIAGMYATRLRVDGFTVAFATDGIGALEQCAKDKPDIIMLDVLMPRMDGFETLRNLKDNPELKNIPVVMLSSMGQKEDIDRGLRGGAADYMVKAQTLPADASTKLRKILGRA